MTTQPTLEIANIKGQTVLVRVNYDLPQNLSPDRILDSKDTITQLLKQENKVVLMTHWGRPSGVDEKLSITKIINTINATLGLEVEFINQFENGFESLVSKIQGSSKKLFILENLRFDTREKSKDSRQRLSLAKDLSKLAGSFVDEGFAVSHRKAASNTEIKEVLPWGYGLSYLQELMVLGDLKTSPQHPFVILMGGAKLETKLPLIEKMLETADKVLLGGLMSLSFVAAANFLKRNIPPVLLGQSEFDPKYFAVAMELVEKHSDKLVLPIDFVYGQKDGQIQSPDEGLVMDLGPETIELFAKEVDQAKTIFWNGPVGYVEQENFAKATNELAKHIAASKAMSVVGGGDTVGNLDTKLQQEFDFVSMGGGATLDFLVR
jgi:phosphoglycerate kinase